MIACQIGLGTLADFGQEIAQKPNGSKLVEEKALTGFACTECMNRRSSPW